MTSAFGWLDSDEDQRKKMLEVVELFKDEGTVDELGIGSIRDTIANSLFPGTSVLHTRIRYVLFVPWLLKQSVAKPDSPQMLTELRRLEIRLIHSLLTGYKDQPVASPPGVIGGSARDKLKRMPSAAYWVVLRRWNIRRADTTVEGFFRQAKGQRALARLTTQTDDPEARDSGPLMALDPNLPDPPPDLLKSTTFDLTADEEAYLSDLLTTSTRGSLLAWLVRNQATNDPDHVWQLDNYEEFPSSNRRVVEHGRRFHTAIYGAPLLYNLLLAERKLNPDLADEYRAELQTWRDDLNVTQALVDWERTGFWSMIHAHNPTLTPLTRRFVDAWLDLINSDADVADSASARDLVSRRERQIKGGRSRLANQAALDRWSGRSGLVPLDYKWRIARRFLQDLYRARGAE
ncbi:MAG: DUF6361 family protein [Nocardioidaceae bacterium]